MKDNLKTNKDFINNFLNTIEKEFKIHCTQRRFCDGYFVFEYGDNSVCRFKIKEIPEFTFGIWLSNNVNLDYYEPEFRNSKLILFAQPTINIDKFKPSRSVFCEPVERYLEQDENNSQYYTWYLTYAESMINYLRKHKIKAFYKDGVYTWDIYNDISNIKALHYYIDSYYCHYKKIIKRYIKNKILTFLVKKKFKSFKNVKAELVSHGKYWSPELYLYYCVEENISEKEDNKLTEIDNWFDKKYFMDISLLERTKPDFENLHNENIKDRSVKILWTKM